MRPSWIVLSLLVHGVAISAALGLGARAGTRAEPPRPRVELQASEASAPVASLPPLPVVEDEDSPIADAPLTETLVVEPPVVEAAPLEGERREPPVVPLLQRVVMPPPAAVPMASPPAPVPAPPQAFVEAMPRADNEPPDYPEHDRLLGHEGTVVLTVSVDAYGLVLAAELRTPSPHPGLNREALRAVRRWRFTPAQQDGVHVASTTDVSIRFQLHDRQRQ